MSTLAQLRTICREQLLDDAVTPYRWSDAVLTEHVNEAQVEACRRARLLVDSTTAAVCQIAVTASVGVYSLDRRVIYVRQVRLASRTIPLVRYDHRDLDVYDPGWRTLTGTCEGYVPNLDTGKIVLYRMTTASDTLNLVVVREPLVALSADGDIPEINSRYHRALCDWVGYRCFSTIDTETFDQQRADRHLQMFEREFGTRESSSAMEEEWQRQAQPIDGMDGTR